MSQRRRVSLLVLLCLTLSVLGLTPSPAGAKRLNLHQGSRGATVQALEVRLARLDFLVPSAVDGRYRAATVHAVRDFQFRMGLPVTGRVDLRTWTAVVREPARRASLPDPSVLGHRGEVTSGAGENTIAAMRLATPYANFLEFDLHRTADHVLVLMHDSTLDRTTNCTGTVASWTYADLVSQCRVGDQPIPTFDEAAAYAASVGRAIAPELKDAGMTAADYAGFVSVIQAHALADRTWVQSVFGSHFPHLRALQPRLRLMLVSAGLPTPTTVKRIGATGVATTVSSLSIPRVHAYHAAGLRIWGWTARTVAALRLVRAMLADGVVTDMPAAARRLYR